MARRYSTKSEALRAVNPALGQYVVQGARGWYVVVQEDMEVSEAEYQRAERRQMGITG